MRRADKDGRLEVAATVNGSERRFGALPRTHLADALRNELQLYGVHIGCEHGICGACTILVDGLPVRSCLMLAVQADGKRIDTVEGMADGRTLSPLQDSFHRHHALQCGFCTAGVLATAVGLLRENPNPTRQEVREVLSGNICRCTGYETIVDAITDPAVLAAFAKGAGA
ncbi:MAG TPA: (2Fe-2S)-binding protein [Stellaceae bacterium]|nr:(2Fe-2S)-binding protein [Stellaceae bacterium]